MLEIAALGAESYEPAVYIELVTLIGRNPNLKPCSRVFQFEDTAKDEDPEVLAWVFGGSNPPRVPLPIHIFYFGLARANLKRSKVSFALICIELSSHPPLIISWPGVG
jgi:hypothetical protein